MDTDPQVEGILAGGLRDVLVCANTSGLEGLAGELFILIGDKVAAERELVDGGTLAAEVEDTDLEERTKLRMQARWGKMRRG